MLSVLSVDSKRKADQDSIRLALKHMEDGLKQKKSLLHKRVLLPNFLSAFIRCPLHPVC